MRATSEKLLLTKVRPEPHGRGLRRVVSRWRGCFLAQWGKIERCSWPDHVYSRLSSYVGIMICSP